MIDSLSWNNRTPVFLAVLAVVACVLLTGVATKAQTTQSPLPPPSGYVNDYAGVVDAATKQRMETILKNLNDRANIQFAVVTVKTTGDRDIFDYSLAVARGWGIGSPDGEKNGLLLLAAIDDRKYFIQVSRHLEGDLPDGLVGEVGRRMRDPFRAGNYGEGLVTAVQTIVATLAEKRGFSIEGIDQRYAYRQPQRPPPRRQSSGGISPCVIIFIIVIILILLAGAGGGGGCLNLLLLGSLFSGGGRGGSSSSGWSGGGFGGSSGGGGGGFGGFGGGGDFGGGGAGGSW